MAYIGHRCTQCGHPDTWRRNGAQTLGSCPPPTNCCGRRCSPGSPEVVATFDLGGKPIATITQPGELVGGIPGGFGRTCDCADCKALHASLTAPPEPEEPTGPQVRAWATEAGLDCPKGGRIPARVQEAYLAAHS